MDEPVILLVEDSASDEELTLMALKKSRIANKVVVVRDGAEALDFLFAKGAYAGRDPVDVLQVVLLDLNLPKLSGLEVLRKIREEENTHVLPVVIPTSTSEERDLIEGYSSGANSYIVKPVDFAQFSEAVAQLGRYWILLNKQPLGKE